MSPSTPTSNSAIYSLNTIIYEKPKRGKEMKQNRDRDIRRWDMKSIDELDGLRTAMQAEGPPAYAYGREKEQKKV